MRAALRVKKERTLPRRSDKACSRDLTKLLHQQGLRHWTGRVRNRRGREGVEDRRVRPTNPSEIQWVKYALAQDRFMGGESWLSRARPSSPHYS